MSTNLNSLPELVTNSPPDVELNGSPEAVAPEESEPRSSVLRQPTAEDIWFDEHPIAPFVRTERMPHIW